MKNDEIENIKVSSINLDEEIKRRIENGLWFSSRQDKAAYVAVIKKLQAENKALQSQLNIKLSTIDGASA